MSRTFIGWSLLVSGLGVAGPVDEAAVAAATGGVGIVAAPLLAPTSLLGGTVMAGVGIYLILTDDPRPRRAR